jgi:hypothetical protein
MNNKIDIINEQFGNFIMAPTIPPPPISAPPINNTPILNQLMQSNQQYTVDNAVLYKKMVDVENEIKSLKNLINSLNHPRPTYYPAQQYNNGVPMLPPNMNLNVNNGLNIQGHLKPNQW